VFLALFRFVTAMLRAIVVSVYIFLSCLNPPIAKKYLGKKDLFPESMGAYIHRNVSDEKNIDNSQAADQ